MSQARLGKSSIVLSNANSPIRLRRSRMHPAFSVLIFTVTAGAGYGLLGWLAASDLLSLWALSVSERVIIGVIAIVLITIGLLSSTTHLANPKNAWRSFSRFRTSWLSREAVFAVLLYPIAGLYALSILGYVPGTMLWALLCLLLSGIIVFVTSMIYASLKTIRQWYTPLVPCLFLLFAVLSGVMTLTMILAWQGHETAGLQFTLSAIAIATGIVKLVYFYWFNIPSTTNIQTATGFTQKKVSLLDAGHSSPSFLNHEFIYEVAYNKLLRLRLLMFVSTFILPVFLLVFIGSAWLLSIVWVIMMAGLLVERWLFFAEARHVVRLYHGHQHT